MSERQLSGRTLQDAEQALVRYLCAHPDFFNRHPELVENLRIPHLCGPAVSLIEHQLALLREQNAQLREKLQELLDVARDNGRLVTRIQRLTLVLIEVRELDKMLQRIKEILRDEFSADFATLRLAAQPLSATLAAEDWLPPEVQNLFELALRSGEPVCGRLTRAQSQGLFDNSGPQVASAALVPLRGENWCGLLAVGSRNEERFQPVMGTQFLSCIGKLISHALEPHLRAPQDPRSYPPPLFKGKE